MPFARRIPKSWFETLRDAVWPRMGWKRAFRYRGLKLMRLSGSPHMIAAGAAAGAFAAFSPFFGFHYLIAAGLSLLMRGSVLAAALVTSLANPLTLPLFWAASYEVGSLFFSTSEHFSAKRLIEEHSWAALEPFLEPLLIGSLILGTGFGVVIYFSVRAFLLRHRTERMKR